MLDRKVAKRDGNIMDKMEDCYPQLLESIKICDAPGKGKLCVCVCVKSCRLFL